MHLHAIRVAAVLSALSVSSLARAQDALPDFVLPEGLEAKVWASTPQLYNPTNIDVDARGRIWVTEGVNYRETYKKQNALKHPEGDRVLILEDTDGDGMADSSKVFVQEKDLICPLGIAVIGDKVIVSCSPHLIVYTDADGDDKPEKKEILLTGFGGFDHDHGLHSVVGGLDGRWYFNVGNMGPHDVTDKSGWRLHSGSCYVYGNNGNTGNRRSDDGRVWTGGIALRVDPDGKNLEPLAHNFRNSYETPIDSFGNVWQSDNDDDGNQGCRLAWVMEGGNYGFFSADGMRTWRTDRRPGQDTQSAHWHSDDPGVMPPGDITGAGGPTGVVVYEGGLLPEKFTGAILNCDTGRNRVWMHMPKPSGAGFAFERGDFIASKVTDDAEGQEARACSARATSPLARTGQSTSPTGTTPPPAGTISTTRKAVAASSALPPKATRRSLRRSTCLRLMGSSRRCTIPPSTSATSRRTNWRKSATARRSSGCSRWRRVTTPCDAPAPSGCWPAAATPSRGRSRRC